jgi:hypothetical protein
MFGQISTALTRKVHKQLVSVYKIHRILENHHLWVTAVTVYNVRQQLPSTCAQEKRK